MKDEQKKFWGTVIERVILNLSDQQLLTGIAILVLGLIKHCTISVYHFTVVSDLAWFSSYVHMTSLILLQDYLRDRPQLRNWRVSLMLVMLNLLMAYTIIEGHWAWEQSWSFAAQCVFDGLMGSVDGSPAVWMSINIVVLVTGYTSVILNLYPGHIFEALLDRAYNVPLTFMSVGIIVLQQKRGRIANEDWITVLIRASYALPIASLTAKKPAYIFVAMVWSPKYVEFILGLLWAAYGLWCLWLDRNIPPSEMDGNENDMTFGQLVPILLSNSTLITYKEAYDGKF